MNLFLRYSKTMNVIVLFTGLYRNPKLFDMSIKNMKKNKQIKEIVFVTWENININKDITIIKVPLLKNNGRGNYLAQMLHYDKGIQYINKKYNNNCYILKTRSDLYIKHCFMEKLFKLQLKDHQIWIPWAHKTKPFYIPDTTFFGKLEIMNKYINYEPNIYPQNLGQGITHIRRFITPFQNMDKYKSFCNEILQNANNKTIKSIHTSIPEWQKLYNELLNEYFIILTEEPDSISFRSWNKMDNMLNKRKNLYLIYSNNAKEIDNKGKIDE